MNFWQWLEEIFGMGRWNYFSLCSSDQQEIIEEYQSYLKEESNECN